MFHLPCDDFIHQSLLLTGCPAKVDAGGLNTLVAHQIRQQSNIVVLLLKVFCVPMPEGMRINHLFVHTIFIGIVFELL